MKTMKNIYRILAFLLALAVLLTPMVLAENADGGDGGEGAGDEVPAAFTLFSSLIMFVPLILVFYFLIIRPESKRKKAAARLRSELIVTDEVTTVGGIVGKVVQIKDDTVTIETSAERTRITIVRSAISSKNEKISD